MKANTNPISFYVDVTTMTISNSASIISQTGKQPGKNKSRYMYFGSFQCRQNMPYMTNSGVCRDLYRKQIIVMPVEKIIEKINQQSK
jgi:hypothetical protein